MPFTDRYVRRVRTAPVVVLICCAPALCRAGLRSALDSIEELAKCGGRPSGHVEFVQAHTGKGVLLTNGAHVRFTNQGHIDPREGCIQFRTQPHWPDEDKGRHSFFHTDLGPHQHITVFRAAPGRFLFVYKAGSESWYAAQLAVEPWRRGTWHHVVASWKSTDKHDLVLCLMIDGQIATRQGARPLASSPEAFTIGGRGAIEPADAVFAGLHVSTTFALPGLPSISPKEIEATVDALKPQGAFPRVFSFTTPWNSKNNRVPFEIDSPHCRRFVEAGFDMIRLVAVSEHWLWGVGIERNEDRTLDLDFSTFDQLLDMFAGAGAEPYVRLAYHLPSSLAPPGNRTPGWAYSAPADMDEWRELMRRIVLHCKEERRLDIRYWVTILNEADIAIRRGDTTWEPVLELYEETSRIVKSIDPSAKIGGPATCGPLPGVQEDGLRRFLRFCRERRLPPDFICFHQYQKPHPRDYETAILALKQIVSEEYAGLQPEYFLDEWNLWARDERANTEYAAAYLAASVHYQIRAGLTRSSIVSFNSHLSPREFAGTRWTHRGPFRKDDAPQAAARFYADTVEVGGVERHVLYTHSIPCEPTTSRPHTFGRFRVRIPQSATLRFGTALAIEHNAADGVGMSVVVIDGRTEKSVFTRLVDQVEWAEHTVDLSAFANRDVDVEFRTDSGRKTTLADHGVWGTPIIESDGRTEYDFCARIGDAETGYDNRVKWHETQSLPLIKGNVVTPAYFTWHLLNKLDGERLPVRLDGRDGIHTNDAVGAMACRTDGTVRVFLWHFDATHAAISDNLGLPLPSSERTVVVRVPGLAGAQRLRRYLIDHDHSNAYTDYVLKGIDTDNGNFNIETGEPALVEDMTVHPAAEGLVITVSLRNPAVTLVELTPTP